MFGRQGKRWTVSNDFVTPYYGKLYKITLISSYIGFFKMWDAAIREMIAINAFNFFLFGKAEMSPSLLPTLNCTHLLSTHTHTPHTDTNVWPDWCQVRSPQNKNKCPRNQTHKWNFVLFHLMLNWLLCGFTWNAMRKIINRTKFMPGEFHYAEWRIWITSIPLCTHHYTQTFDEYINVYRTASSVCLRIAWTQHFMFARILPVSSVLTLIIF